ncbi:MAG: dTMP kinase [Candidatus Omnitrophica bacterium CG07_land_8_20_14_0_80_50_8]|nr:MAG: dTMP kinase [Candidatus Omnitrophica bacterium CG07_land_8_20_14_0_80_50_8]
MPIFDKKHAFPGKLIIVEGIDGSGKSTQIALLKKWLESQGFSVFFTEWNSSELVKETTREGKKRNILTPTTFSLLHATDFADRLNYQIIPPLKAGMIVLADRYAYTAFARDVVRGVHPAWVRNLYNFAIKPDISFYFDVPIHVACDRILSNRTQIKFHEAGMDLGLSLDTKESFKLFQTKIFGEYKKMQTEFALTTVDATLEIHDDQEIVRAAVKEALKDYSKKRTIYAKRAKVFWRRFTVS